MNNNKTPSNNTFLLLGTCIVLSLSLYMVFQLHGNLFSPIQSVVHAQTTTATASQIYWGATIDGDTVGSSCGDAPWCIDGKDYSGNPANDSVTIFETHTGKQISIFNWGTAWYRSSTWPYNNYVPFQPTLFDKIKAHGSLSLHTWSPIDGDLGPNANQPNFSLARIIQGNRYGATCDMTVTPTCKTFDAYLTEWATGAKNWGYPFFLRLAWEMNGNWYSWSELNNGNSTGQYVQAWRHIHDIFTQVGATNVTWVWCPNVEYSGSIPLSGLYPGDAYVDWTCMDGYNSGTDPGKPSTWKTFTQVFQPTYDKLIQIAPSKPIMIAETASSEYGGSKATWITDALGTELPNSFSQIRAFLWFDWDFPETNGVVKWSIESSQSAQDAFKNGIASSYYAANTFADIPPLQPIQPIGGPVPILTATPTLAPSPTPTPITGTNYIQNASFENAGTSWLSPWNFNVNTLAAATIAQDGTDAATGTYAARVNVTQSNSTIWYVQLKQSNLTIQSGSPVLVRFFAKASAPRTLNVVDQKNISPYTEYANQNFNITTSWQQYSFQFTPAVNDTTMLSFNMANTLGLVWIDGVEFVTNLPAATPTLTPTFAPPTPTNTPLPTPTFTPSQSPMPSPTPTPADTTAPTVTITSPANNSTVKKNSNITIAASASDNKGVTRVTFSVNGVQQCSDTTSPYSCSWRVPNTSNVPYTIIAQAFDAAGNSRSTQIQVTSK